MAEIIDVYFKVLYKKNNEFQKEDIFDNEEMLGYLLDLEYGGTEYINEDKKIYSTLARWSYINTFTQYEEGIRELYEVSKKNGIEKIYYIYSENSYAVERVDYGVILLDVANNRLPLLKVLESYDYNEHVIENFPELKKMEKKLEEADDDYIENFYEELDIISYPYLIRRFEKFLERLMNKVEEIEFQDKKDELIEVKEEKKSLNFFIKKIINFWK